MIEYKGCFVDTRTYIENMGKMSFENEQKCYSETGF